VFTAGFVFIGAVVYMLLAPKGREDPATLRGREPDEGRAVEELAGELAAVARGSGILAAVTVAGDHEQEDAEAVGDDIDVDAEVDSQVDSQVDAEVEAEVEAEESATEIELEDDIAESGYVNADVTADEAALVIEAEPATDAEQDVLDEVESTVVIGDGDAVDEQAEIAEDDGPVVVYASAPEAESAEIVVVYESTSTDEAVPEVVVEAEAEPEVVVEAEAEPEAVPEVVVEAEAEDAVESDAESDAEAESKVVVEPEPEPEPETAGFGSTLRRLLWGVGSKGGD
jgi:hypothetical protein